MTATPHQHITDLKEQRRTLQQRARSIRATTGLPYSSEVHLLLGQSYLDPASWHCLLYTSPSPRDPKTSRMPSSA